MGPQDQPWFLNAVVRTEVSIPAPDLLVAAKRIEGDMGREPTERWGPRIIDIDLLLYADETIHSIGLVVPHPELWNRRFVLLPLADLITTGPLADMVGRRLDELGEEQAVHLYSRWGH